MEHGAATAWLHWLQDGAVGQAMRKSVTLYPAVETLHIIGLALLVGSIAALDLRLLGAARRLPALALSRLLLPIAAGGFVLAAVTGALLFTTEAASTARNPAFLAKLTLIAAAGANAAALHLGVWRRIAAWGERPPAPARAAAALSLLLWGGAVACGRLIAYF